MPFSPALLKQARKEANLSLRGASAAIGMDVIQICQHERGQFANPTARTLERYAHGYGVPIDSFFTPFESNGHKGSK